MNNQEINTPLNPDQALEELEKEGVSEWQNLPLFEMVDCLDGKRIPVKKEDRENMAGIFPYYGASGIIDYVDSYIFNEDIILLGEDGENVISIENSVKV